MHEKYSTNSRLHRYEIEGASAEWEEAERAVKQADKSGKSAPLVSVKSQKAKRKASPEPAGKHDEGHSDKGHKKSKKAKRDKKR